MPRLGGTVNGHVDDLAALVDAVMDDLGLDDPLDVTSSPDASMGAAEEADDVEASDLESPPLTAGHPDMDRRADGGERRGRAGRGGGERGGRAAAHLRLRRAAGPVVRRLRARGAAAHERGGRGESPRAAL